MDHIQHASFQSLKAFKTPPLVKALSAILIVGGAGAALSGWQDGARGWGSVLICNYYFVSLILGAAFFAAIQRISQAGWSAMFLRIPEAIGAALPVIALVVAATAVFGTKSLYHWSHGAAADPVLRHKSPYLNVPFFVGRCLVYLGAWLALLGLLRRLSLREDREGGLRNFVRSELLSKVFIFVLALTFSLATFDWIMSIDADWFSTIFAIKDFVSAFYHGSAAVALLAILLHKAGYLPILKESHLRDFAKYLFMLSLVWAYTWFSQFFLIWYAHIPEETVYYTVRLSGEWKTLFLLDPVVNWLFPFLFLLSNRIARNADALAVTALVLLAGFWLDIYLQVMPGLTNVRSIGRVEVGTFLAYLGAFVLLVTSALGRAPLVPRNHPFLIESALHEAH
jgi:hypothetical protein